MYDRRFGDFPAIVTVYTPCIYDSGQPYKLVLVMQPKCCKSRLLSGQPHKEASAAGHAFLVLKVTFHF